MTTAADGASAPTNFAEQLETWSNGRSKWQRHALWLLSQHTELSDEQLAGVFDILQQEHGLAAPGETEPVQFEAQHLKPQDLKSDRLVGIREVANVNRLCDSGIDFDPDKLTVVYGDNGSGKSGFIRILRKACRSRIEKPEDLAIIANVYGETQGTASALIKIVGRDGEKSFKWEDGTPSDQSLASISVFDTRSAELYVDHGNRLRYLPNGLDLPFRLNDVIGHCEAIVAPQLKFCGEMLEQLVVEFQSQEISTDSKNFYVELSHDTRDQDIDSATAFSDVEAKEQIELEQALSSDAKRPAELKRIASSAVTLADKVNSIYSVFNIENVAKLREKFRALEAARKSRDAAAALVSGRDPLPGIGSEAWTSLWGAARAYAAEVDAKHAFPLHGPLGTSGDHVCPLCQQHVTDISERFSRFDKYISSRTVADFDSATAHWNEALQEIKRAPLEVSDADDILISSVRAEDNSLSDDFFRFLASARTIKCSIEAGPNEEINGLNNNDLSDKLKALEQKLLGIAAKIIEAQDEKLRAALVYRSCSLVDKKQL